MNPTDTHSVLETAIHAAREGGRILFSGFRTLQSDQVALKAAGDYVTDCDHDSERTIIRVIREAFPDHTIHAEESGSHAEGSGAEWFIDPLDGTANFVQGLPIFAISLAWVRDGEIRLGVVHDPVHDELFHAVKDGGAFLNDRPIRVSGKSDFSNAMLATGFPWRSKPRLAQYLKSFETLFGPCAGIRRMGAATLDLAYTACGRYDGFWEMKLKPWDIGAGILLVREAGGVVTDFNGESGFFGSGNLVAGTPDVYARMLKATRKWLSDVE